MRHLLSVPTTADRARKLGLLVRRVGEKRFAVADIEGVQVCCDRLGITSTYSYGGVPGTVDRLKKTHKRDTANTTDDDGEHHWRNGPARGREAPNFRKNRRRERTAV